MGEIYIEFIKFLFTSKQEIDNIIQTAQNRGYMDVFRLGSKSVDYASKIIMQEANSVDNNLIVSHQLMNNMSLSSLADDDFSSDKNASNSLNYNCGFLEQRHRPSIDYRYEIRNRFST